VSSASEIDKRTELGHTNPEPVEGKITGKVSLVTANEIGAVKNQVGQTVLSIPKLCFASRK
jgi:hypothetical protein